MHHCGAAGLCKWCSVSACHAQAWLSDLTAFLYEFAIVSACGKSRNWTVVDTPRLIYFVPQDAVFLGGLFYLWHNTAASISPKARRCRSACSR